MVQIKWENGQFKTEKKAFVQYDYGQYVEIIGLEPSEHLMFQFIKNETQYDTQGSYIDGKHIVRVPDEVLAESGLFGLYCFYEEELQGHSEKCVFIDVLEREMYPPREPEEYHDIIAKILDDIAVLQYRLDHFELTPEQLAYIVEQVEEEIDLNDYYDKTETDALLANKADKSEIPDVSDFVTNSDLEDALTDYYDKAEIDTALDGKANISDIPDISGLATKTEVTDGLALKADKTDTYTKTEVNNLIPDVSGFATKTELNDGLALKANAADVYAKTETYSKSEVYNKTEIDATLGNILTLLEAI